MEIIIGLIIVAAVVYFFTRKSDVETANEAAPYKVETPVAEAPVEAPVVEVVAEGAGIVEVPVEAPAKPKKAKKAAAITAKPKAPAKPRAKKAKAE